jgi:hypothetical protein
MAASLAGLCLVLVVPLAHAEQPYAEVPASFVVSSTSLATPKVSYSCSTTPIVPRGSGETLFFRKETKGPQLGQPGALGSPQARAGISSSGIQQTALLQADPRRPVGEEYSSDSLPLDPPSPDRLFKLESEPELKERMRQRSMERGERIIFPSAPIISKELYMPRQFALSVEVVEPNYLCHKRLLFEDINSERYGWDLGVIQPLVSVGHFYKDLVLLPYHAFTRPCDCFECTGGYCLPGDPVPYLCYPPEISLTGALAEAAAVATLFVIFP